MSIDAKPWPGGGAASVPDASETVKGIIEIADSTESTAGTDDLKAMTPLKVKQRIDAALVGGVDYKGSYTGQSLVTAQQGDMNISAATYSLAGVQFLSGDHLIFNQDASDPVTSAMFDKIDNTDAVSSVNTLTGAVVLSADDLAADHSPSNYIPANANIDGHLSGIDDEFFLKAPKASPALTGTPTSTTATQGDNSTRIATTAYVDTAVSAAGNQINDIVSQTGSSFTAQSNYVYKCGYGLGTQTITMPDASGSTKGDLIGFTSDIQAYSIELVSSDGTTNDLKNINNQTKGGTNGALAITVDRQISWFICDANQWLEANAALSTLATTGAYSDLSGTPTIPTDLDDLTDVVITGTPASGELLEVNGSNQFVNVAKSTINLSEFNDDLTYIGAVVEDTTPQLGGPLDVNGQAITSASNGDVTINPDGTGDISIGADMIPDADATHTIGDEDNRFISAYTDINGAIRFKAKNDSGGVINKGQAVYIKGVSGTVPTVALARANSALTMPAFGLALASANDQAELQVITFGNLTDYNTTTYSLSANDTVYVSAATAGALTNSAPTGESNLIQNIGRVVRADASAGIIKVGGAGRSNATPNLDDGKIFLGNASNQAVSTALSAISLTSFNDDLGSTYQPLDAGLTSISGLTTSADKMIYTTASDTYAVTDLTSAGRALLDDADASAQRTTLGLGTAATSNTGDFLASTAAIGDISDVTITSVSNGQVLSYNSTSGDWENTTPTSGGATDLDGLSDVTITSVTGGDLLQNNGSGQFVNVAKSTINLSSFNDDLSYQPLDAGLTSISGLTTSADKMIYTTASDTYAVADLTSAGRALLDDADASAQRTTLGLGTAATSNSGDFQPIDAGLTSISGLTTAADKMIYTTASDTYAVADLTSAGRALLDDADASAQRTTLGVAIGSDVQAYDAGLASIAGLTTAADKMIYTTASDTYAVADLTSAGRTFLASTAALNDISDVTITSVSNGQVLSYNSTSGDWENTTPASGGGGWTYSAITADPANAQANYHYSCTGTFTITLPTTGMTAGEEIRIKNMGTGTITIDPQTSNIDGSTTDYVMDVQYSAITLVSTGTHWEII